MNHDTPQFPEYGMAGDRTAVSRERRAFRLVVLSGVLLTALLWFAEEWLRFEHTERLYRSALTLVFESSRPVLQAAIREDEKRNEFPTPKYVEALAARQNDDEALETYARAHALDPGNASLSIQYGCLLFRLGRLEDARKQFNLAAKNASENALPSYLAAASYAWTAEDETNLSRSLAIIARANNGSEKVTFPRPLWFRGLPQDGQWYAYLQRRILDNCLAPIYRYVDAVAATVDAKIEESDLNFLIPRLEALGEMGRRFIRESRDGSTAQLVAGIYIEQTAIDRLIRVAEREAAQPAEELILRRDRLAKALEIVQDFERDRDTRIVVHRKAFVFPGLLLFVTGVIIVLAYPIVRLAASAVGGKGVKVAPAHSYLGLSVIGAGVALAAFMLLAVSILQHTREYDPLLYAWMGYVWWGILIALGLFGFCYPALALERPSAVAERHIRPEAQRDALPSVKRVWRAAYGELLRKYFGLLFGLLTLLACAWIVFYRIFFALYPWQINLLNPGLLAEEAHVVNEALRLL